ncbi:MAG: serine/threonine-protein phosphatase [Actinomycetota bacterium]|nr:serine/threonine-protein phosphatase [Actinomycetota bacterium]
MSAAVKEAAWRRARTRRRKRRVSGMLRRAGATEASWLVGLTLACLILAVLALARVMPLSAFVLPVLVGGLSLGYHALRWLLVVVAAILAVLAVSLPSQGLPSLRLGALGVVAATGLLMLWSSRSRTKLGVAGSRGESMLIDLRDRLRSQGEMPPLPRQWYAETVMRSAGGASFAGDFMVAAKSPGGEVLEVAVVDVSGKGLGAGTRALLLSGAFGGLLGSVPPERFLPSANQYLLRQEWGEGFATAVYLVLNLRSGEFEIRTAGHPPAVRLQAGSGRWLVQMSEGPVLGVLEQAEFTVARGRLQPGDVLLLYTDGLVETPQRDITLGIDKLLGEAERLATRGFDRGASRLVDRIASQHDDRALVLLHRQVLG